MTHDNGTGYAGDVSPSVCLEALTSDPTAQLVDVRTTAEWAYVGAPDLRALGKEPIRLEWQVFPTMSVDPAFTDKLAAALQARGLAPDTPLYFLCRSGIRSKAAASAATGAGQTHCYNVLTGFEGVPDPDGHRGRISGWKVEGLPWIQS